MEAEAVLADFVHSEAEAVLADFVHAEAEAVLADFAHSEAEAVLADFAQQPALTAEALSVLAFLSQARALLEMPTAATVRAKIATRASVVQVFFVLIESS